MPLPELCLHNDGNNASCDDAAESFKGATHGLSRAGAIRSDCHKWVRVRVRVRVMVRVWVLAVGCGVQKLTPSSFYVLND